MTIKSELVITDNFGDKTKVFWDGERFSVVAQRTPGGHSITNTILLNPREASELADFINSNERGGK